MQQADSLSGFQYPMTASSSRSLLRLLWENRGVDPQCIHIHRNPYDVFVSTRHLYRKTHPLMKFQSLSRVEDDHHILRWYALMMRKLLVEQSPIPVKDFVEVRFEDLELNPLATIRRISLGLLSWEQPKPALQAYLATIGD